MSDQKARIPKIRFAGFKGDWVQRKVGDYYYFKNGLNKGKEFFGYGIPIVNFTDVFHNRGICASILKGKVHLQPSEIANYKVQKGDIFFTRTSETIDEIGYSSVMLDEPKDTVFSGFVLRGRAIDVDPLTINFKRYIFYTDVFRKEMVIKSSMTTRALTSGTAIKEMEFKFPQNTEEQDKIGVFFTNLDNLITLQQRQVDNLIIVKKTMLEKMFPKDGAYKPEIRFSGFTDAWEQRKVKDLFEVTRGKVLAATITSEKKTEDAPYPVYSSQTKQNGLMGFYKEFLYEDAITWTTDGANAGTVNYRAGKFYCTNVCGVLLSNEIKANQMLAEVLNSIAKKYVSYVGNPKLMNNVMADIEIKLPSQEKERDIISSFFCDLDNLLTLHQREINALKTLKKSMLQHLFV